MATTRGSTNLRRLLSRRTFTFGHRRPDRNSSYRARLVVSRIFAAEYRCGLLPTPVVLSATHRTIAEDLKTVLEKSAHRMGRFFLLLIRFPSVRAPSGC